MRSKFLCLVFLISFLLAGCSAEMGSGVLVATGLVDVILSKSFARDISKYPQYAPMIGKTLLVKKEMVLNPYDFVDCPEKFVLQKKAFLKHKFIIVPEKTILKIVKVRVQGRGKNSDTINYYVEIVSSPCDRIIGLVVNCWLLLDYDLKNNKFEFKYAQKYLEFV